MLVGEDCVSALGDDLLESIALQHRCIFGGVVVAHGCGGEAVRGRKKREAEWDARTSEGVQMPIWDARCHSRSYKVVMPYISRAPPRLRTSYLPRGLCKRPGTACRSHSYPSC